MKSILIPVAKDVQDQEFFYPYYRIQEEGWNLDVAAENLDVVKGKFGIPIKPNITFVDMWDYAQHQKYDAIIIPGGWAPESMRMDRFVIETVKMMNADGKLIAAICHGPQVMISARIIKDRYVTGYVGIWDDICNAGGCYTKDGSYVQDKNFITSSHYKYNPQWMKAIVEWLKNRT